MDARAELAADRRTGGGGFDGVFSSAAWWDFFVEEYEILRRVAPVLGCPEPPFARRLAARPGAGQDISNAYRQSLRFAAAAFDGVLVPMGFECATRVPMDARGVLLDELDESGDLDLVEDVRANHLVERLSTMAPRGEIRNLTGPDDGTTALLRLDGRDARVARGGLAILVNPDLKRTNSVDTALDPMPPAAGACLGEPSMIGGLDPFGPLAPGAVRLVEVKRIVAATVSPISRFRAKRPPSTAGAIRSTMMRGASMAALSVCRSPRRRCRTAGTRPFVRCVEEDIFSDGHGVIAADLLWKAADEKEWSRIAMRMHDSDRIGRNLFTIDAWADEYATVCRRIDIKSKAAVDHQLDLEAAYRLVKEALAQGPGPEKAALAHALGKTTSLNLDRDRLLAKETQDAVRAASSRRFLVRYEPAVPVEVERPQAGVGAEMCRHLTALGFPNTPPLLGEIVRVASDGSRFSLAVAQGFVRNQGDAWTWLTDHLLMARDDLTAAEPTAEADHLSDYKQLAAAIGLRLGEMHKFLAQPTDDPAFSPLIAEAGELASWRDRARTELDAAFAVLKSHPWERAEDAKRAVELLQRRTGLLAAIEELPRIAAGAPMTRIHGDFHLGQVLVASGDVFIIDFEGGRDAHSKIDAPRQAPCGMSRGCCGRWITLRRPSRIARVLDRPRFQANGPTSCSHVSGLRRRRLSSRLTAKPSEQAAK
jgi:Domain of unknown function (DUF3416)/Phosphotransferase enzyme family